MSLTAAVALLALALLAGISKRLAKPPIVVFLGGAIPVWVCLAARGPEPARTYVACAAIAVALILLALRLSAVQRQVLSRMRVEAVLFLALVVAIGASEFLVPDTSPVQRHVLAVIAGLTTVLIATVFVRVSILFMRAARQKRKPV